MSKIIDDGFQGDGPMGSINVTSLVDVMFCLLIMFMVSAPMMSPKADIEIDLPKAKGNEMSEDDLLLSVISVDVKGRVYMGSTPLSEDPARMAQEIANNPKVIADGRVFIQGDENVPYERIVDVLVALQTAKVIKVGFVTDPSVKRKKS
ncbi:MAG: biopolymer transporter ExbD [Myxococcales bacterium]|nr:biopolymer transporter ExbD [Myxococcales bacterium]MCB9703967.1 biopolymer transporter ExbD [Myxococcales bacterium]